MSDLNNKYLLDDIPIYSDNEDNLKLKIKNILDNKIKPLQIITLNIDFLRTANIDKEFKEICKRAHIVLPDGIGITLLMRLKYKFKIKRITGNDILKIILNLSSANKLKIAFLGSSKTTLLKIKNKIQENKLKVEITNLISPPLYFEEDENLNKEVIEQLSKSRPEILFVALGCPRQEKWIDKYKDDIEFKLGIGIGAALDFFAGSKKRSPLVFQRFGMEWVWRLISEPKRLFRRYVLNDIPYFIKKVIEIKINR